MEIDPTSKWNNYADLFIMCKDGFGVGTLVPDRGESINQVVYFPDNVQDFDQLWKLHEEFNVGRDLNTLLIWIMSRHKVLCSMMEILRESSRSMLTRR